MNIKSFYCLLLISLTLWGCQQSTPETELSGETQGTTYHIKLVMRGVSTPVEEIKRQVNSTLAEIDARMSNYREDSEISRLNQLERSTWLPVSKEITGLLSIAKKVYDYSNGCYDLTVKPLFDLWGFSRNKSRVPNDQEINKLLPHVGMSMLEIDGLNHLIRKKDPKLKIDLSSIAQGYSLSVLARVIEALGVHNYLIEIGGETMVKGHRSNGGNWRIWVESPNPKNLELDKFIEVNAEQGIAVMTAGSYRNYFEDKDQAYSHIINPKTGRPITHHLRSVTIMHYDPVWADAWDTALLCVGEQQAMRIIEAENLKAMLIYDKDDRRQEYKSKAFAAAE